MYTNSHSSVGAIIVLLIPGPLGFTIAFFSHFVQDFFAEIPYHGGVKRTLLIEIGMLFLLVLMAIIFKNYAILLGAFFANIPDMIDKTIGKNRVFPFHRENSFWRRHSIVFCRDTQTGIQSILIFIVFVILFLNNF